MQEAMAPANCVATTLIALLILHHCRTSNAACSTSKTLTASEGTVNYPTNGYGSQYKNDLDICWLIRSNGTVVIKFSRLDVESCCDKVHIYENTRSPSDTTERFRLSHLDVLFSEYWLTGDTLVRFKTDGSKTGTGFTFRYTTRPKFHLPATGSPVPTELIKAASGRRTSHVTYGAAGSEYSNNMKQVWSIDATQNQLVHIRLVTFSTESGYDYLRVYSGIVPRVRNESLISLSGEHSDKSYSFAGGITLVFTTDGSEVKGGFTFDFNITSSEHMMDSIIHRWTGTASGGSSISLVFQRSNPVVECTSQSACSKASLFSSCRAHNITLSSMHIVHFDCDSSSNTSGCIQEVTCNARWSSGEPRFLSKRLALPQPNPESVRIELMHPDLWSQTGVIQFRAVSEAACPSVRHRCELRTANGSVIAAHPITALVSPPIEPLCLISVMTQFAVVTALSASVTSGSSIACRLLNGSFVEQHLQSDLQSDQLAARRLVAAWWQQELLVAAVVTLALVLCALTALRIFGTRLRAAVMRRRDLSTETGTGTEMKTPESAAVAAGNQYTGEPVVPAEPEEIYEDEVEAYVA